MFTALAATWYLHRGWIQLSLANLLVIVLMLTAFVAAVLLKMPGHAQDRRHDHH